MTEGLADHGEGSVPWKDEVSLIKKAVGNQQNPGSEIVPKNVPNAHQLLPTYANSHQLEAYLGINVNQRPPT